jgi:hypothetical protein
VWLEFVGHIAEVGSAAAFLIVVRAILNWLRGSEIPDGGLGRAAGEDLAAWVHRLTGNPFLAVNAVLLLAVVGGMPFFVMDLWDFRNADVELFWVLLLENTLYGLSIIGALLVLRAFGLYLANGSAGSFRERLAGASEAAFYDNPAWLLRFLAYAIATVGLVYLSLRVWNERGDGFWEVWYYFFLIGFDMLVPLAVFIGGRALYAEAWAEQPAMLASTDGKVSQPAAASLTPPGSTGTLA